MNSLPANLSPPSTKTPLTEEGSATLNHNWQRWFSDLYLHIKGQDSLINAGRAPGTPGAAGSPGGSGAPGVTGIQGPQGPVGPATDVLADGGFANSTYLPSQLLDGGSA